MNINRHNYETFFLLYTDNELSAAEKKTVDEFVEANADLQEELVMLQQSILKPDNVVFDDKRSLLKHEFVPTELQEKLLLYLDNELTLSERNEIERLFESDATVRKEWNILQQTRLPAANKVVFEDKGLLYRKEEGKIIAFPWRRMAAAAVFIGFVVWGGLSYFNKAGKTVGNEIVTNSHKNPRPAEDIKPALPENTEPQAPSRVNKKEIVAVTPIDYKAKKAPPSKPAKKVESARLPSNDVQTIAVKDKTNNLPEPYFEKLNNTLGNKPTIAYVAPEKQSTNIVHPGNNEGGSNKGNDEPANAYASVTSFTDNNENNENRVLFMNEEKVKRSKLGGIFRKVKRVLERSANIRTGDNKIKVANLEFAIQ